MRLIDADALIKEACAEGAYGYVDAEQIADAPTVYAEPTRHGHWEYGDYYDIGDVCSVCFWDSQMVQPSYRYCPRCGAKMDEG